MSFLLDTNVVSELRKGSRADPGVRRWFEARDEDELFLSVLVLGELRKGVERLRRRDPAAAQRLDLWVGEVADHHANRILTIDTAVAEMWGRINADRPQPVIDSLLAATAIVHDLTVVSRNTRDFAGASITVVDPFDVS